MDPRDYSRRHQREPVKGHGEVTWDPGGTTRSCAVYVNNLSPGGVQIVSPLYIEPGSAACLSGQSFEALGCVRYCFLSDDGFRAGLEFTRQPYPKSLIPDRYQA